MCGRSAGTGWSAATLPPRRSGAADGRQARQPSADRPALRRFLQERERSDYPERLHEGRGVLSVPPLGFPKSSRPYGERRLGVCVPCVHGRTELPPRFRGIPSRRMLYLGEGLSLVLGRSDYQWQHEPVLYGFLQNGKHPWFSDRKQTTIWNIAKPKRNANHPTSKPVDLLGIPSGTPPRRTPSWWIPSAAPAQR